MKKLFKLFTLTALLAGCGGGSDAPVAEAEVIAGMNIPSSVSAVSDNSTPTPTSTVAGMNINWSAVSAAYNSSGTDYSTDNVDSWIDNPTAESIGLVNLLLCVMEGTGAEKIPNGNYKALVDMGKCESAEGGSTTASGVKTDYSPTTVSSSRVDNSSNQNVNIWMETTDGNKVLALLTVFKSADDRNPLGEFTMNWKDVASSPYSFKGVMKVYTADGKTYIKLWESNKESGDGQMAVHVELDNSTGTSGRGLSVPFYDINNDTKQIDKISYNDNYLKSFKGSDSSTICYDRNDLYSSVYRTKLYEKETGNRLDLKGGFSATYTKNGSGYDAFFGRWGLWTQDNNDTPAQITRRDGGSVYDMIYTDGKLVKTSSGVHALVDGDMFRDWSCPSNGECTSTDFFWKAFDSTFRKSDGTQVAVSVNDWISSLQFDGGSVYKGDVSSDGNHKIKYYQRENITPWSDELSSGDLTLTCYGNCPTGEVNQADLDNQWNSSNNSEWTASGRDYAFDKASMQLKYGASVIKLASSVTDKNKNLYMRLVPQGTAINNYWEVYDEDTSYEWNVGLNSWNRSQLAKDSSGAWYEFDKPVQFAYTHTTANDRNGKSGNNGKNYFLKYNGSYLEGFNWSKDLEDRWVKDINLSDGIELYTDENGRKYVNKAIGIDNTMKRLISGDTGFDTCNELNAVGVNLGEPSVADITEVTTTWEDKDTLPNVADEIKVIHGVLQ